MGPKSIASCSWKRKAEGKLRRWRGRGGGGGRENREADTGAMLPPAEGCLVPAEAGEKQRGFSPVSLPREP